MAVKIYAPMPAHPKLLYRLKKHFPNVTRVADASAALEVTVTKDDGSHGKKKQEDACAMANACVRQYGCEGALIRPRVAYLISGDLAIRFSVPNSVAREIVSFDRHHDFRPGDYQLSAISKCNRLGRETPHRTDARPGRHKHRRPLVTHHSQGIR